MFTETPLAELVLVESVPNAANAVRFAACANSVTLYKYDELARASEVISGNTDPICEDDVDWL
jgi:hypothetical protein